jgi:sporulation protein YlmC with PRC-barrel domain
MSKNELDLGLGVLDHQLIDCDSRRCGKVDDLELKDVSSQAPQVVAILVGPAAWRNRGPVGRLSAWLARRPLVRVPWTEVQDVGPAVTLRRRADELRLGRGDDKALPLVERLPGSSL